MQFDGAVVDFETAGIDSRPNYPPKPVSAAIIMPGGKKEFLAWGHPDGNNCTVEQARRKLAAAYEYDNVLFHHAAFDMDVAQSFFGLNPPKNYHDTLFLAFLEDPHRQELGLKEIARDVLAMPADEQADLRDWIMSNVKGAKKSDWGKYIDKAPAKLVGKYALGDVVRTQRLFNKLYPSIVKRGMEDAYNRELDCVPITLEMERSGIRIDVKRLQHCYDVFSKFDEEILKRIARKLKLKSGELKSANNKAGFNINSGAQLGKRMMKLGMLTKIFYTPKGAVSTKIANLREGCSDKTLLDLLAVHSVVEKYISSFLRPWLEQTVITGGRILPKFNQTRGYDEGGGGARSGRYSSSDPNMQNISANVEDSQNRETLELMQKWLKELFDYDFIGLRDLFIPDHDSVIICTDYNQQEIRILAHFENGVLTEAYNEDPKMDVHTFCQQLVKNAIGIEFPRKHIKVTVFGIIYGMGIGKLAARLGVDYETAKRVRDGIMKAVPGISRLMRELKSLANRDKPLITWGGRQYYCEEPRYDKKHKRWMSFEYKMLNYLIQPSAADCTKAGMINIWNEVPEVRLAVQVHDETVCMAPNPEYGKRIAEAMCDVKFNVPMLAEPKSSKISWARAGEKT